MYCECSDWLKLKDNENLFYKHPSYGWVLRWTLITEEEGYAQIDKYAVSINYCPFCGNRLNSGDC